MARAAAMPDIKHPKLRQMYEYWDERRGDRPMPARGDVDPVDLRYAIGNIILVDVSDDDPPQFRIRVHGTNLSEQVGFDLTGKLLDEMPLTEFRELTRQSFIRVSHTKEPLYAKRDRVLDKRRRAYETLILPLSSDGERVDRILLGLFYDHVDR